MNGDEGGGASLTTDPASGSSAATDVSLREFMGAQVRALDRHLSSELASLRRETEAANQSADKAIEVASIEAKERLDQHNGLIQKMEQQAATFVSREVLDVLTAGTDARMSRIERLLFVCTGGLMIVGLIGIANLVKVWAG